MQGLTPCAKSKIDGCSEGYAIAVTAVIPATTHVVILYSRAPSDSVAMGAHFGKFVGDGQPLRALTQVGAADSTRRPVVGRRLFEHNCDLNTRVSYRTATEEINESMHLLDQITRAIGQCQGADCISQMAVRPWSIRGPR